jgi:hypothetical protein
MTGGRSAAVNMVAPTARMKLSIRPLISLLLFISTFFLGLASLKEPRVQQSYPSRWNLRKSGQHRWKQESKVPETVARSILFSSQTFFVPYLLFISFSSNSLCCRGQESYSPLQLFRQLKDHDHLHLPRYVVSSHVSRGDHWDLQVRLVLAPGVDDVLTLVPEVPAEGLEPAFPEVPARDL